MLFRQQADEGERLIDLIIWPQSRSAVEAFFQPVKRHFCEIAYGSPEYEKVFLLRNQILREPFGLDFRLEDLSWEASSHHYAVFQGNEAIACVIAIPERDHCYRIRQMATKKEIQGQGIGSKLMRKVESELAGKGGVKISLNARVTALGFYQSLGYHSVGDEFVEVTIPHQKMEKRLQ